MSLLRLQLLGPPRAWRDDQLLRFKRRKTLALLAYLGAESGLHARDALAALLWPETAGRDARSSLRTALVDLRQVLGESALTATREAVGLAPSVALDLDLQTLRQAQGLARALDGAPGLRAQLEQAVALYRGPFLAGLDVPNVPEFETWLEGQRTHWLDAAVELLERLAMLQADAGEVGAVQGTLERWVALEPGEERAWQRLLALSLERGDVVGARRAWAACRQALADLDAEPGGALQALAARLNAASHADRPASPAPVGGAAAWGDLGEAPLVGRAGPLATLHRAFARTQAGQAQVVVLQGEAGIGKTRLASEYLAWARVQSADVLVGRAFEAEGSLPYAPLVAALRPRLERENAPDDLLGDLWLAELARLLPELRERYPDLPLATEDATLGQGRLFEAVARLGQTLAVRHPLVLFLDDVQWADVGTRDLLRYAVRRWAEAGARALVLLAVRAEDVGTQRALGQWLGGLGREAPITLLELERLVPDDVVQLVGALAGDAPERESPGSGAEAAEEVAAFGQWLAGKTGGQPFYVTQTLRALLEEGLLGLRAVAGGGWALDVVGAVRAARAEGRHDVLPAGVRALIRAQVAHLDERAEEVLAAGTVLGGSFSSERVLRVAAVEERSGERVLDYLVRGRLLHDVAGTGTYTVGHDLVREVLYAELGEARRRGLHRRALAVLEEEGALAAELARHALAAGLVAPTVRHSVAAGDAALAMLAVRDALAHYERARALAEAAGPESAGAMTAEDLALLYLHLGRAYELAHEPAQAGAAYHALRALAQQRGLVRAEIASLSHLAMLAARAGDLATARTLLGESLTVAAASGDRPALVEIETHLADIAQADPAAIPEAQRHGEHALALARELEQPHLVAASLHELIHVAATVGDWERAAELAEETSALYAVLDTQPPPEHFGAPRMDTGAPPSSRLHHRAMQADALQMLSMARTMIGEPQEALEAERAALAIRQAQTDAVEYAVAVAFGFNEGQYSSALIRALVELGAYAEALRVSEQRVALMRILGVPYRLCWALDSLALARLAVLQGDAARVAGEEMRRLTQRLPVPFLVYHANARLCAACVLMGDWASAHAYALHATEARTALQLADLTYYDLTAALLRGGDAGLARAGVCRFGEDVGANRRLRIPYLRARATLAQWDGAREQATRALEEAQALAAQIGLPGEQWQIAALLAQTYRDQGQTDQADRAQAQAQATLQALAAGLADPALRASFLAAAAPMLLGRGLRA